jgi:hypothetical protein
MAAQLSHTIDTGTMRVLIEHAPQHTILSLYAGGDGPSVALSPEQTREVREVLVRQSDILQEDVRRKPGTHLFPIARQQAPGLSIRAAVTTLVIDQLRPGDKGSIIELHLHGQIRVSLLTPDVLLEVCDALKR